MSTRGIFPSSGSFHLVSSGNSCGSVKRAPNWCLPEKTSHSAIGSGAPPRGGSRMVVSFRRR